jgi:hypothetical protein
MGFSLHSPRKCRSPSLPSWPQACTVHFGRSKLWVFRSSARRLVGAGQAPPSLAGRSWRCSGAPPGLLSYCWWLGFFGVGRRLLPSAAALARLAMRPVPHDMCGRSSSSAARGLHLLGGLCLCGREAVCFFAVRPNPSLNTRPSTAERLAREALTVYAAPRGQGARPLRAR